MSIFGTPRCLRGGNVAGFGETVCLQGATHDRYGGFQLFSWGSPQKIRMVYIWENPNLKWMITGDSPISGNRHMIVVFAPDLIPSFVFLNI